MKEYLQPRIEVVCFSEQDVITSSGLGNDNGASWKEEWEYGGFTQG